MKLSSVLKWVGLALLVLLAVVAYRLLGTVIAPKVEERIDRIGLTSNEVAANGPLPGVVSLYAQEYACSQKLPTPGYYPSLNAAEVADGQRSGIYPCATFTGSFDGPNQVFAWRAADPYQATEYIVNRRPGELFVAGGANPPLTGAVPAGPYIARVDAATGKALWRTYFENANASGRWLNAVNLNFMTNGQIVFAWQNNIALVDPDTGLILKHNTLPTGATPPSASGFKNLTIAPDGTIIVKNQTRPTGFGEQGTLAIIQGVQKGFKQPPSTMVAVDPKTLEVLDQIDLPEPSTTPHVVSMFEGRIAIYVGVDSGAMRYFWDPASKKLSRDESWTVSPMEKGQTTSDAPSLMGEWIILQTNGLGSKTVASSIVAVHQKDAKRFKVIFPFGPLKKGEMSFAPPKPQTDPENQMIYSADMGVRKVAGIKLDPASGDMKVAFTLDITTTGFQPLVGTKDKRVMMLSNMKPNVAAEPIDVAMWTANYTEQVTWHDAATGRQLAASDFFEPMTFNGLIVPGFGGRVYYTTDKGFVVLQVMPKAAAAPR
jgi:hypothetical protein